MGYSPLVDCIKLSTNCNCPRNHVIDRISIHVIVGQVTAERGCEIFQHSTGSSCNYVVDLRGRKGLSVDENNRSWCTSSKSNDHRAITIEVASDRTHPYAITPQAYAGLLDLVTDICQRYGKKKLLWINDKEKALAYNPKPDEMLLTVHRWFARKACPGDYLYLRHDQISAEVNARLQKFSAPEDKKESEEIDMSREELKALIREVFLEVYNEVNPLYEDLKDVPPYWQELAKALLDAEAVNGGTNKEVCATDLNIRMETLKAAIIALNYHHSTDAGDKTDMESE